MMRRVIEKMVVGRMGSVPGYLRLKDMRRCPHGRFLKSILVSVAFEKETNSEDGG